LEQLTRKGSLIFVKHQRDISESSSKKLKSVLEDRLCNLKERHPKKLKRKSKVSSMVWLGRRMRIPTQVIMTSLIQIPHIQLLVHYLATLVTQQLKPNSILAKRIKRRFHNWRKNKNSLRPIKSQTWNSWINYLINSLRTINSRKDKSKDKNLILRMKV